MEQKILDASLERWQRLQALLDDVLELAPDAWAAYVDAACRDDAAMRQEVMELLAISGEADRYFDASAAVPLSVLEAEAAGLLVGREVGSYRLVRVIGQGGMGTVYLAERADRSFRKTVAIKLVRRGMDTAAVLRRFRNERQILASLDHPHIARLYDGGMTPDGLPYFVMEYVDGEPIDAYCDRHRLPVAERLRLFRVVCEAVQYAHHNLIVHCDLKPSNILVTEAGEVRLLDFGIARMLAPGAHDVTVAHARFVTPACAAPEQLTRGPVTTATDVYALGILLYELLSGHRPFSAKGLPPGELERRICEVPPPRPSTRVLGSEDERRPEHVAERRATTPHRLRRELAGDLDTVVATALEKDPALRYRSAVQLADDVANYLAGRPLLARPVSPWARSVRFVRRHTLAVTLSAVAVLSLVVGFAVAMRQAHVAAVERDRARQAARQAEQVADFMVGLFEEIDPGSGNGRTMSARELLDLGAGRASEALQDQPEVRATLLDAIGRVYRSLGLYAEARPLLEQALAERKQVLGGVHVDVAESAHNLGYLELQAGRYAEADSLFRAAAALRRRLLGADDLDLASGLGDLSVLLRQMQRYDEAEAVSREVLAILQRRLGEEHPDVASALVNLAGIVARDERHAEAEALLSRALAIYRHELGDDHVYAAVTMSGLARAATAQGNHARADTLLRDALAVYRTQLPDDHPWAALALFQRGQLLHVRGRREEALVDLREALARRRRGLPAGHPDVGASLVYLGRVVAEQDPAGALPLLREGLTLQERAFGAGGTAVLDAESLLGACLARLGRFAEAEQRLLHVERHAGAGGALLRDTRARLVALYEAWGRPAQAARYR